MWFIKEPLRSRERSREQAGMLCTSARCRRAASNNGHRGRTDGCLVGETTFLFSNTSPFLQVLPASPSCAAGTEEPCWAGGERLTRVVEVVLALERLGLLLGRQHLVEAVLAEDQHLALPLLHLVLPQQLHDLLAHCGLSGTGLRRGSGTPALPSEPGPAQPDPTLSPTAPRCRGAWGEPGAAPAMPPRRAGGEPWHGPSTAPARPRHSPGTAGSPCRWRCRR